MKQTKQSRSVIRKTKGIKASDGAGVSLTRIIGSPELAEFDPFLMLDYFESTNPNDYIAGFPPHPHRGFETVTYLLAGKMRHKDNQGHEGVIEAGGVQWMTAGKGIIHSEMPEQENGLLQGFQLWVNLPSHAKMVEPAYQEFSPQDIPVKSLNGVSQKVIAGENSDGIQGPVTNQYVRPLMIDITLEASSRYTETFSPESNIFIYVIAGRVLVNETESSENKGQVVESKEIALLSHGDSLSIQSLEQPAQFLLVSALPLNEPIVKGGPFVMNTEQEIEQAFADYKSGQF